MVRFTLFGIPVEIQPWFWLTAAFFGGLLNIKDPNGLQYMLMFMFASTVSILVHEFGHALTGRRLAGGQPNIVLWAFGGLAYNRGARFTRWQDFWMTLMGPGAGFLLFIAIVALLAIFFGPGDAASLVTRSLFGMGSGLTESTATFFETRRPLFLMIYAFLWINFWWGLVNLLPVLPLDGGRIAEIFVRPQSRVHTIAIVAAASMAIFGLVKMESFYVAILFGYLAYQNYKALNLLR